MQLITAQVQPLSRIDGKAALMGIQKVAKTCYKSNKDTDDIESAKRVTQRLIESGHHSMLEVYSITMNYVSNIAAYKDLTRHRHATFAVESSRWCNYSKGKFGQELKFLKPVEIPEYSMEYTLWLDTMQGIENSYMNMASLGAKPDQLSLLLPQSTAAEFNICANLREWRHILSLRSSIASTGHARPCITQIMDPTLELFHKKIPVVFDDLYEQYKQKAIQSKTEHVR